MPKIDVIKKNINFEQLVKQSTTSTVVKNEYLIPDTHPDAEKILFVDAKTFILSSEVLSDKVIVGGKIEYNVIYIPREDGMTVNSVDYSEDFTTYLELNNLTQKISCDSQCEIEHIEFKIMNERKIEIECILKMNYDVFLCNNFDFIQDINGDNSLQVLRKHDKINEIVSKKNIDMVGKLLIRVPMDKPEIGKIVKVSLNLHKKEIKLGEDKVYLGCYCKLQILYMDNDSGKIYSLYDDMYISKEEEISGVFSEMTASAQYDIDNKDIKIEDDDLGESRVINLEVLIKCLVKIFYDEEIEEIEDVYSTKYAMNLTKEQYNVGILKAVQNMESIVRDNINLKENDIKPDNIIAVNSYVVVADKNISINKLSIEGQIIAEILYKGGEDEKYYVLNGIIPFNSSLDINNIDSSMKATIKCLVENIEATIESNNISLKIVLSVVAKVYTDEKKTFIVEVTETEEAINKSLPSITLYIANQNDTLWELAKKYNTTTEYISRINDINNSDEIIEGQKILIPGKCIF